LIGRPADQGWARRVGGTGGEGREHSPLEVGVEGGADVAELEIVTVGDVSEVEWDWARQRGRQVGRRIAHLAWRWRRGDRLRTGALGVDCRRCLARTVARHGL